MLIYLTIGRLRVTALQLYRKRLSQESRFHLRLEGTFQDLSKSNFERFLKQQERSKYKIRREDMNCRKCNEELSAEANFCRDCGESTATSCWNCNTELEVGSSSCGVCKAPRGRMEVETDVEHKEYKTVIGKLNGQEVTVIFQKGVMTVFDRD